MKKKKSDARSSEFARWERDVVNPSLGRGPERRQSFQNDSGIHIDRLYIPDELDYAGTLGYPGEYPFTRGVYPTMYRSRFWTMRQYAGFGTAEESNRRYRYLIDHGTTGLSVAFDLPTQIGYDSDHSMSEGEVGKVGVAIDTLADMERLFEGIDLQKVTTSMTINATAAIILCMYIAVAKKKGADLRRISGTVQNDVLKEYIARGTHIYPPAASMRLVTDLFEWAGDHVPRWNTISISGYHIREAGSTAAQEIAFTLSNAIAYVQAALDRGLNIDEFGKQLSFFFNSHNNFFEEIAKFRAARRMWASIMKERFGATNTETMKLRFHAQTGGSTLTAQQIDNNVVRVTLQALAAVLGGCQSLHTNARDEALALPTEDSVRLALRTQQIIAHESGVGDTVDPIGGSYYVESLTGALEQKAWEYIREIDAMGGAIKAIEKQYYQTHIAESAYSYQKAIEEKGKTIVGVNDFQIAEEVRPDILEIDESHRSKQVAALATVKKERNQSDVAEKLADLRKKAEANENVMSSILSAVEVYASLGEISDVFRQVWGEYKN